MMWFDGMGWLGWFVMASGWVLFVAGVGWLVGAPSAQPDTHRSARRVLDQRFAVGELSVDDYEERRRVLG